MYELLNAKNNNSATPAVPAPAIAFLNLVCFGLPIIINLLLVANINQCGTHREFRSPTWKLITNRAIANLIFCTVSCIYQPYTIMAGHLPWPRLDSLLIFAQASAFCAVLWATMVLAVNRYFAITRPYRIKEIYTHRFVWLNIALVYVISFIANIPKLIPSACTFHYSTSSYTWEPAYDSSDWLCTYVARIPLLIAVTLSILSYVLAFHGLRASRKKQRRATSERRRRRRRKEVRLMLQCFTVTICQVSVLTIYRVRTAYDLQSPHLVYVIWTLLTVDMTFCFFMFVAFCEEFRAQLVRLLSCQLKRPVGMPLESEISTTMMGGSRMLRCSPQVSRVSTSSTKRVGNGTGTQRDVLVEIDSDWLSTMDDTAV